MSDVICVINRTDAAAAAAATEARTIARLALLFSSLLDLPCVMLYNPVDKSSCQPVLSKCNLRAGGEHTNIENIELRYWI